jgi:hypothetical protein
MNSKQEPQAGKTDRLAPIQSFPNRLFPSGLAPIRLTTCKLVQEDNNLLESTDVMAQEMKHQDSL